MTKEENLAAIRTEYATARAAILAEFNVKVGAAHAIEAAWDAGCVIAGAEFNAAIKALEAARVQYRIKCAIAWLVYNVKIEAIGDPDEVR